MVEHVARERLPARPGKRPIGRWQADRLQLFLGLLPDRHSFVGDVERNLRHMRHGLSRVFARMKALRSEIMLALCIHQTGECFARHRARPCPRRSLRAAQVRHLQDRRPPPDLSAEDIACAPVVRGPVIAAGLETTIDGIGNMLGKRKTGGAKALSGSHLESQNHAGWLDGALGCVYALEAARAIQEAGGDTGVDVVAFCDEEGHFGSFLGSRSFTGLLKEEDIDQAKNKNDGTPMREALSCRGLCGAAAHRHRPERYKAFFEAHIEQGDSLEAAAADRRGDGDRGDLAVPHHGRRASRTTPAPPPWRAAAMRAWR